MAVKRDFAAMRDGLDGHQWGTRRPKRGMRLLAVGAGILVFALGVTLPRVMRDTGLPGHASSDLPPNGPRKGRDRVHLGPGRWEGFSGRAEERSAEQIVADKLRLFSMSRRSFVRRVAHRLGQNLPAEVEAFFDALEAGDWAEIERQWTVLSQRSGQYEGSTHSPELDPYWPAILDAYGAAEQAHAWPASKLLDYGHAILEALRPGMVYVGGTDEGRWIPTLLNETRTGPERVIITQNALADLRYLEFVNELYAGRIDPLTKEDFQGAYQDYKLDVGARWEHDQQFPDQPKQVRPGEDVRVNGGEVEVAGLKAVMAINEKLLRVLMAKNSDLGFAVQESFPFPDTYPDALPLGPLMELEARNEENAFSPERAGQSLDHWREKAQALLTDPEASGSPSVLKTYSKDVVAAANLLAAHEYAAEAEEAYRLANQLWPANPESAFGLANLYSATGREAEARQALETFVRQHPDRKADLEWLSGSKHPATAEKP